MNLPVFCSWSGGKDSSLALYRSIKQGATPRFLLTMMIESGDRSRSHGIPRTILQKQAACLGIPIRFCATSWESYSTHFSQELRALKNLGIEQGIFGDIDLVEHRKWVEEICVSERMTSSLPLWQEARTSILEELASSGFRAEIVAVKDGVLPPSFLGRVLNTEIIHEFNRFGIDLCGEAGEYHTIVTDGPLFSRPLNISHGDHVLRDGYWFSDIVTN